LYRDQYLDPAKGESADTLGNATAAMWIYIKENNLLRETGGGLIFSIIGTKTCIEGSKLRD
jgi:hypothetical protein